MLFSLFDRSAWGNDLCSFHPRYRHLCSSDDVFDHTSDRLLHCVDLRRRDHTDAVLYEHPVSVSPCLLQLLTEFGYRSLLLPVVVHQGGCGLGSRKHSKLKVKRFDQVVIM